MNAIKIIRYVQKEKIIEPSNGPTKRKNIPGAMLQLQIVHYHLVASAVACEIVFSYPIFNKYKNKTI